MSHIKSSSIYFEKKNKKCIGRQSARANPGSPRSQQKNNGGMCCTRRLDPETPGSTQGQPRVSPRKQHLSATVYTKYIDPETPGSTQGQPRVSPGSTQGQTKSLGHADPRVNPWSARVSPGKQHVFGNVLHKRP